MMTKTQWVYCMHDHHESARPLFLDKTRVPRACHLHRVRIFVPLIIGRGNVFFVGCVSIAICLLARPYGLRSPRGISQVFFHVEFITKLHLSSESRIKVAFHLSHDIGVEGLRESRIRFSQFGEEECKTDPFHTLHLETVMDSGHGVPHTVAFFECCAMFCTGPTIAEFVWSRCVHIVISHRSFVVSTTLTSPVAFPESSALRTCCTYLFPWSACSLCRHHSAHLWFGHHR